MKAVAVLPGKPNSVHLADLPKPAVTDVPGGQGVLVRVLRVGVDGTDKEINAAEYGAAPAGYDFLVIGHEGFGRVEVVGPNVTAVQPGDYVVATVRRPGTSLYDLIEALGARFISTAEMPLLGCANHYGPFDIIFEATGFSPIVFDAMQALAKNGVLVLSSITGGDRKTEVPADRINLDFVLGNKVMVGTVNAAREHFEEGVRDMAKADRKSVV